MDAPPTFGENLRPAAKKKWWVTLLEILGIALSLVAVVIPLRLWETPTARAYRICFGCGFDSEDVDKLIAAARDSGERGEADLASYHQRFDEATILECEDCEQAIIDAAEVEP